MKKRVIIVHGWASFPEDCWFPWYKKELEARGFEVIIPEMPDPIIPRIESWVKTLSDVVGVANEETYFVGHSVGCQTILRYLEIIPTGQKIGGAVFVAGFFELTGLETEEEKGIADPWIKTPINLEKVGDVMKRSVAIFSDNDEYVPLNNQDIFRDKLGSEIIIEHNMGHFDRWHSIVKLQSALDAVLRLSN